MTGFLRPTLPFRKGKKRDKGFALWPELAEVLAYQSEMSSGRPRHMEIFIRAAFIYRGSMKC